MAAATGMALGLLGTGLGAYQAISGNKMRRDAERELNDYDRQALDNAFKDISISTEGVDLMRDENARASGNLIDAASNAGSRAIIGAAPRVSAATNNLNAGIANYLDEANNRREYAIAGDNARIENIIENRDIANINALNNTANTGRQDVWSGIMGAASGLGSVARNYTPGEREDVVAVTNNAQPAGLTPLPTPTISATPLAGAYMNPPANYGTASPSPYNPFAGFPSYFNSYS